MPGMPGRIPEDEGQDVSDEEIQKPTSDAGLRVMYPRHPFVPDDDSAYLPVRDTAIPTRASMNSCPGHMPLLAIERRGPRTTAYAANKCSRNRSDDRSVWGCTAAAIPVRMKGLSTRLASSLHAARWLRLPIKAEQSRRVLAQHRVDVRIRDPLFLHRCDCGFDAVGMHHIAGLAEVG
jgi:hypothetical protein